MFLGSLLSMQSTCLLSAFSLYLARCKEFMVGRLSVRLQLLV